MCQSNSEPFFSIQVQRCLIDAVYDHKHVIDTKTKHEEWHHIMHLWYHISVISCYTIPWYDRQTNTTDSNECSHAPQMHRAAVAKHKKAVQKYEHDRCDHPDYVPDHIRNKRKLPYFVRKALNFQILTFLTPCNYLFVQPNLVLKSPIVSEPIFVWKCSNTCAISERLRWD